MSNPSLFLASCELGQSGEWEFNDLSQPAFVLVKDLGAGKYQETFLIHHSDIAAFKNTSEDLSYVGPNSLAPAAFLTAKGLTPADYKKAVFVVEAKPIASMPNPQSGPNMRFEVKNSGSAVQGQLYRSDNAGAWQDTWALKDTYTWGTNTVPVKTVQAAGLPGAPAAWASQAKTQAAGGSYVQYSYSFSNVI